MSYRTANLQMLHFIYYSTNICTEYFKHAAHTVFSLQNAVYFIMLPFLVPVLFTFYKIKFLVPVLFTFYKIKFLVPVLFTFYKIKKKFWRQRVNTVQEHTTIAVYP